MHAGRVERREGLPTLSPTVPRARHPPPYRAITRGVCAELWQLSATPPVRWAPPDGHWQELRGLPCALRCGRRFPHPFPPPLASSPSPSRSLSPPFPPHPLFPSPSHTLQTLGQEAVQGRDEPVLTHVERHVCVESRCVFLRTGTPGPAHCGANQRAPKGRPTRTPPP